MPLPYECPGCEKQCNPEKPCFDENENLVCDCPKKIILVPSLKGPKKQNNEQYARSVDSAGTAHYNVVTKG